MAATATMAGRGVGRRCCLTLLLLLLLLAVSTLTTQAAFTCKDGSQTLPDGYWNDDYCDCEDGSDEPGTAACSLVRRDESFACNRTADGLPLLLFASRVGDGICDCCDGSDEAGGVCSDTCEDQARAFVEAAQAQYKAVLEGWLARNEALAGVKATMAEWTAEVAAIEARLAGYAPILSKLEAYKSQEERTESWEKLAWLREQAHKKRQSPPEQNQPAVQQAEGADSAAVEGVEAPEAQQMEAGECGGDQDMALKVRVLYEEEDGLDGVQRVLEGMVASEGGRSVTLKEYLEEQEAVAQGAKPTTREGAPSVASVLASGSLDPKDVIEMNLQAMGALMLGPFKALAWSFQICLEELYAACGWEWTNPFGGSKKKKPTQSRQLQFSNNQQEQAAAEDKAASPLARWWHESVAPTTLGWAVASFLQGPNAAIALLRPDTIEGAPDRLEASLLHAAVDKIEEELGTLRERAVELRSGLAPSSLMYGPEHVFLAWQDKCFSKEDKDHTYAVCPFKDVKQGYTLVGRWAGWGRRRPGADAEDTVLLNKAEDVGRSMFYHDGAQCWNGPKRSAAVALTCGAEERVVEISEPSVCVYDMVMETPLLCDNELLAQAEARLAALGVSTPQTEKE